MSAALKLNMEAEQLSQKPPLGEKVAKPRLVWENPNLTAGTQKEKRKVKANSSYGRVLYNYYRYYDPETGRYITSDPIGLDGGINTYLYANANSLRYTDPNGEAPLCPPGHRGVPLKNYEDEFPKYFECKPYPAPFCMSDCVKDALVCGLKKAHCVWACRARYSSPGRGGAMNPPVKSAPAEACIRRCEKKWKCREKLKSCGITPP
jgi:RHS repeat-associated protein